MVRFIIRHPTLVTHVLRATTFVVRGALFGIKTAKFVAKMTKHMYQFMKYWNTDGVARALVLCTARMVAPSFFKLVTFIRKQSSQLQLSNAVVQAEQQVDHDEPVVAPQANFGIFSGPHSAAHLGLEDYPHPRYDFEHGNNTPHDYAQWIAVTRPVNIPNQAVEDLYQSVQQKLGVLGAVRRHTDPFGGARFEVVPKPVYNRFSTPWVNIDGNIYLALKAWEVSTAGIDLGHTSHASWTAPIQSGHTHHQYMPVAIPATRLHDSGVEYAWIHEQNVTYAVTMEAAKGVDHSPLIHLHQTCECSSRCPSCRRTRAGCYF